jgi:hypothetical protein
MSGRKILAKKILIVSFCFFYFSLFSSSASAGDFDNVTGDTLINTNTTVSGEKAIRQGSLTINSGVILEILADSTLQFEPGYQINIDSGAQIFVSASGARILKGAIQCDCVSGDCCDTATCMYKDDTTVCNIGPWTCTASKCKAQRTITYCSGTLETCSGSTITEDKYATSNNQVCVSGNFVNGDCSNYCSMSAVATDCNGQQPRKTAYGCSIGEDSCNITIGQCGAGLPACSGDCDSWCSGGICQDTPAGQDTYSICSGGYVCSGNTIVNNGVCGSGTSCGYTVTTCTGGENSRCVSGQGTCQNLCSDGIDNDGDGSIDSCDSDCGSVQCTSGDCCDTATCTFRPNSYVCRAAGVNYDAACDQEEKCTGSSSSCPVDVFKSDGTGCLDDGNPCTQDYCSSGICVHSGYCAGSDTSCGCTTCTNCNNSDGWYDFGSAYACCDGSNICTCQDQKYRDYYCAGTSCTYTETSTRMVTSGCSYCSYGCSGSQCNQCSADEHCGGSWICSSSYTCMSYIRPICGSGVCRDDYWHYDSVCNCNTYNTYRIDNNCPNACPSTYVSGNTCYYNPYCSGGSCTYANSDPNKPATYYSSGGTCYYNCSVTCTTSGWSRSGCSSATIDDGQSCTTDSCTSTGVTHSACECSTDANCNNYCSASYPCKRYYPNTCNGCCCTGTYKYVNDDSCGSSGATCPSTYESGSTCSWSPYCSGGECAYYYSSSAKPATYYSSGGTCYYNCSVTCTTSGWSRSGCSSATINDGNPCTTDSCTSSGVTHTNVSSGTACPDDGYACTDDYCDAWGTCIHPVKSSWCKIAGVCYGQWTRNPSNQCEWCDHNVSPWYWSLLEDSGYYNISCGTCKVCSYGSCVNAPNGTACSGGTCQNGVCCQCTSGDCCDGCNFRPTSYNPGGLCKKCTGSSATSVYQTSSEDLWNQCTNSTTYPCMSDYCRGGTTACGYISSGTVCRAASGVCDVAETCSGSSFYCPLDYKVANNTQVTGCNGECDACQNGVCSNATAGTDPGNHCSAVTECWDACSYDIYSGNCNASGYCAYTWADCPSGTTCHPSYNYCYSWYHHPDCNDGNSCTNDTCDGNGYCDNIWQCADGACACYWYRYDYNYVYNSSSPVCTYCCPCSVYGSSYGGGACYEEIWTDVGAFCSEGWWNGNGTYTCYDYKFYCIPGQPWY